MTKEQIRARLWDITDAQAGINLDAVLAATGLTNSELWDRTEACGEVTSTPPR